MRLLWKKYPDSVFWAVTNTQRKDIEELANQQIIDRFFLSDKVPAQLSQYVDAALALASDRRHKKRLKKDLQKQNSELTALAEHLEELVDERTANIHKSKMELEAQSGRVKNLVRFVSELSRWHDVDELLTYMRNELRIFHELSSVTLFWTHPNGKNEVVYWQGANLMRRICNQQPKSQSAVRLHEKTDQVFLASQLERPVGRTLAVTLSQGERSAVLFFEHALSDVKLQSLQQFIEERLQVLRLTWERIIGEKEALQTSLQWERVFDSLSDPIAIIDREYNILRANRRFLNQPGEKCFKRWAGRDSACPGCPLLQDQAATTQLLQRGDRLWNVYSYPIEYGNRGEAAAFVNHYVDVTDTKKLFEKSVQNEKMVAIGLLAGHIAHELNNPLTGLQSLAQVVRTEVESGSQLFDDLGEVEKAAKRCQKIIENFLEFSRGSEKVENLSLNDLIEKTLPLLKTAFREHRTEFNWSEEKLLVRAEAHLLQQVIFNLVNNGCQSMEDQGLLRLGTFAKNDFAVFEISDSGVGIAPELLERIFEPFFTTKREGVGTGLGLSLSRSIVEKFGGKVEVESTAGKGSTFRVLLPLQKVQA